MPLGIPHSMFLSWDESDQDKALMWQREHRTVCPQCGTRPEDWAKDRFAFVADPVRCTGCETIALERENIPEGEKGIYIPLVPREIVEARMLEGDGLREGLAGNSAGGPPEEKGLL